VVTTRAPGSHVLAGAFPLVGRGAEMELLESALGKVTAGAPHLVLLTGEAGVGKTRLVQEFARRAEAQGARVLSGRALAGLPHQPLTDCLTEYVDGVPADMLVSSLGRGAIELARLVPDLADRLPERTDRMPERTGIFSVETEQPRLVRAISRWLRAASSAAPLVLLLDDLEHLDRETAALLGLALPATSPHPVLVVGTARDTDLPARHPIRELSGSLRRLVLLTVLPLSALTREALADLAVVAGVHTGPADLARLTSDTGGNAFLATQALVALAAQEPHVAASARAGIDDFVRERLAHLSDPTREALTAAAVAGERVQLEHVAAVWGRPEEEAADALAPAVAAHLLDEQAEGQYRFVHMLVRKALLDALGRTRRAHAHHRLATHLEIADADRNTTVLDQFAFHHAAQRASPSRR
jgi:predicted ATPase